MNSQTLTMQFNGLLYLHLYYFIMLKIILKFCTKISLLWQISEPPYVNLLIQKYVFPSTGIGSFYITIDNVDTCELSVNKTKVIVVAQAIYVNYSFYWVLFKSLPALAKLIYFVCEESNINILSKSVVLIRFLMYQKSLLKICKQKLQKIINSNIYYVLKIYWTLVDMHLFSNLFFTTILWVITYHL